MANDPRDLFPLFDHNPNTQFEFVAVTDINMSEYPYFFKAVFRNIDTNEEVYVDNIYPEAIKQRYFIGHIYKNKKFVRVASNVKMNEFEINKNACALLQKISDVINEEDARLINNVVAYNDFMEQYVHVEMTEKYVLIIPCSLIAVQFYLLYGQMKKAAMEGMLENLYYPYTYETEILKNGTRQVYLEVKSYVPFHYRQDLMRFINSSYTQARFNYIFAAKDKKRSFQPIRCNFPIAGQFKSKLYYIQIGKDQMERPKYLVLHMHSNDAIYDFDKVICTFL